ncbi:MAG: type II secretion system protein GspG [Lentisphaeraceae bacterium]|nr:type II secretion system protein GspG [Lentisphaeraceae bacterium]
MKKNSFTLLELILVVLILGLISSSALLIVDNQDGQQRYDESKRRLAQIRYALIGKDDAISNETTKISGYMADMGEVPTGIADLLVKPAAASVWTYNSILGFGSGWRGPYINTFDEEFKDGWGFDFRDPDENIWDGAEASGDINIISYNENGEEGGIDYARDLKLEIPASVYKSPAPLQFTITVINETGAPHSGEYQLLCLYPDDDIPLNQPNNFFSSAWLDLDAKFKSSEVHTVSLQTSSPDDRIVLSFTLNQELIFRKLRVFLVRPNEAGASIQEKIVNNPDLEPAVTPDGNPDRFDHIFLYSRDLTTPSFTFRIK